jgi:pentatricopeptide repeat protein
VLLKECAPGERGGAINTKTLNLPSCEKAVLLGVFGDVVLGGVAWKAVDLNENEVYLREGDDSQAWINWPACVMQVWDDAINAGCQPDCRMCTVLIEVCTRKGDTARALKMYDEMRLSPPDSKLAPSVHAYTAAMRAAAEGGQWQRALEVWRDMTFGNCRPTGVLCPCLVVMSSICLRRGST